MASKKDKIDIDEPSIIVKPLSKFGGLDNIHVALLGLVVILILLLLVVSYNKQVLVKNVSSNSTCVYGAVNGTCVTPHYNSSQIKGITERLLASYANLNTSLSLIPYITNVSAIEAQYMPSAKEWYVSVRANNPLQNRSFNLSAVISDTDGSVVMTFIETINPTPLSSNYVASAGIVRLYGKVPCLQGNGAVPVYWFIDPYAPGALQSLQNYTQLQRSFGSKVNMSLEILYSQYSQNIGKADGQDNTQQLGKYLFCASAQRNFANFSGSLSSFQGYISPGTLSSMANISKLDIAQLNSCLASSQSTINAQAILAQYYNITTTPVAVADCQYMAIPQTARSAICYSRNGLC
ncbi:MAG: hypothetical protein KGI00_00975 [Candidatus Micrarchaeota archaeon]|nr:hypothetical protein [Candidatus Micrarchaeota archaeon]MDE1824606.1 hypothetical protein [Candidatus Micrarchaeota archaeon]MDE1849281.1 hypothetical protein [Candidatus Micrarchaeota archaeon]